MDSTGIELMTTWLLTSPTPLTIGPQTNHENNSIITPHKTIQVHTRRTRYKCARIERHCTCTHPSKAYGAKNDKHGLKYMMKY